MTASGRTSSPAAEKEIHFPSIFHRPVTFIPGGLGDEDHDSYRNPCISMSCNTVSTAFRSA